LKYVDAFARDVHSSLVTRNLTDIVDVVFVSDHGMTDTGHPELLYIDDILGEEGWEAVEHEDGGTFLTLGGFLFNSSDEFRLAFHGTSLQPFGQHFLLP
jgi:predicted AlkP superfamily pyrophosphatase or phosphodiesterase